MDSSLGNQSNLTDITTKDDSSSSLLILSTSVDSKRDELQQLYREINERAEHIRTNLERETSENDRGEPRLNPLTGLLKKVHFENSELNCNATYAVVSPSSKPPPQPNSVPIVNSTYNVDKLNEAKITPKSVSKQQTSGKSMIPIKSSPVKRISKSERN